MGKCINHPERETSFLCMKHNVYMCEECLHCRDPKIYCKFRSSCPIWFMEKRVKKALAAEKTTEAAYRVIFRPSDKEAMVAEGSTLLETAQTADVPLNASCNGNGACGKCKLILASGKIEENPTPLLSDHEKKQNYILACQSRVYGDVTVKIPEETLEKKMKIAGMGEEATARLKGLVGEINPMLQRISLKLTPPSLDDPVSNLDRLYRGRKKKWI